MASTRRASSQGRIRSFDSLRGIAALGVVLWHYGAHFKAYPLPGVFSPFYQAGYLLVDFFFVLSGYVIAQAYWQDNRSRHLLDNIRSRLTRLYPLHLMTLCAVALIQWMLVWQGRAPFVYSHNDKYHFFLNALLLNGVGFQDGFSFNAPSWSISTEFVVNCVFMIFIASAPLARGIYALAIAFVGTLFFLLSHSLLSNDRVLGYLDPQLLRCAAGFGAGVALQLLHRREWLRFTMLPAWTRDLLAVFALTGIVFFLKTQGPHASIGSYLIAIALSAVLLAAVFRAHWVKILLQAGPLVFLGEISYSIYLMHFPLQLLFVLFGVLVGHQIMYGAPFVAALYFALLIGLSYLTYRLVELPCQTWLNSRARSKTVGAAVSYS